MIMIIMIVIRGRIIPMMIVRIKLIIGREGQ